MGHYRPTIKSICDVCQVDRCNALHIGGRYCQEYKEYEEAGFSQVFFWESDIAVAAEAQKNVPLPHVVLPFAAYDVDYAVLKFNVCSDSAASSLLNLGKGTKQIYPGHHIVDVKHAIGMTVDTVMIPYKPQYFTYLALDVQGSEREVWNGMQKFLQTSSIEIIDVELDYIGFYENGIMAGEMVEMLDNAGFQQAIAFPHYPGAKQADGIFVKRKI